MTTHTKTQPVVSLKLEPATAADLMTPNPVSVRDTATVAEAIALLVTKGFHAAPVIDAAGHPVGVLSGTDILTHERETAELPAAEAEVARRAPVGDLMTPVVFSLAPDSPTRRVIEDMAALNVHQLYVVDRANVLVGVISALDVIRRLAMS